MITITLSDETVIETFDNLEVPLTEKPLEGASDVIGLDNSISTYFTKSKREWSHTWSFMSQEDYIKLRGFYDRQWTNFKYPKLTCQHLSINNVPVRMSINDRTIIDNCGLLENVTITLREA